MGKSNTPYVTLGNHLKYVREQQQKSLAEVSGAVEIAEDHLQKIESGHERPSEDILLLLISHFNMSEQQAIRLWELANYTSELPDQLKPDAEQIISKQVIMLLAADTRTIYTDGVNASANDSGVTLCFTQASGPTAESTVSKLGMSTAQAEKVVRELQTALLKARYNSGPKQLPPSVNN